MGSTKKVYRRADVLYGKCEDSPTVVEAVQFHGIKRTKNDALVEEIAHLYRCCDFGTLLRDVNLTAKHLVEVGLMENAIGLIDICKGNPHSYVVSFVVKEPKSFTIGAKAGVSTYGETDGILNGSKRSAFGRGEVLNASYTYTVKGNQTFNFSFLKPFLGWQKYKSLNIAAFRNFFTLPWNVSETGENGIIMQYSNLINKHLRHGANINLIWRKFFPLKEAAFSVREFAGHSLKLSLENSVAYDTRNNKLIPSKGLWCNVTQELAGLLGDSHFIKHQVDLQASTTLWFKAFITGTFQASYLMSLSNDPLHLLDRLYIGGPLNLRGFGLNSLGSRNGSSSLGGIATYFAAFHVYRPLMPSDLLFAHAYLVSGAVLPCNSYSKLRDLINERRVSAGVGITFVFQDLVRLELNYNFPLRYHSFDSYNPGFQFGAGINFL
uniref:Bac_surface_Ag domain-containing protein n=1 Tax=Syphacia muris TaxID=451379 RepID=A0A158R3X1_9BILA